MRHTFLDFELDPELYELRRGGAVVATQARVFAFIQYLLEHRERVVGKDELIRAVWHDSVVSEAAISQVVMLARKTLGDESDRQLVIKTVRGRGFRFVAEVRASEDVPVPAPMTPPEDMPVRPGLIGRDDELAALWRQLEATRRGRGGLVLIGGEPGIGKTALITELARRCAADGVEVSWGRAWEEAGAPPFWPWIQVLRAFSQRPAWQRARDSLGPYVADLAALLPELASAAPSAVTREPDGPRARFRQFDAVKQVLQALAADGGPPHDARVVILDDLHSADDASLQLLRFLSLDIEELGWLFVATFRDLELLPGSALATFVDGCAGSATRLDLRGVAADAAASLVTRQLGHALPEHENRELYELSAGNPLVLASLVTQRGDGTRALSRWSSQFVPERVAGSVRRQLAQLPERTQAVLAAASAFGREFPLDTLAQLHACDESELLALLEPARRRGVIHASAQSGAQLAFSHALFCRAVYSELDLSRRRELHRRIAELLERSAPPEHLPLYELAHHYDRAAAAGCQAKALEYARLAAQAARRMAAYETAAALYERAAGLAQEQALELPLRFELLCEAGATWYHAGELERAVADFDRAAELAQSERRAELFAIAVLHAGATSRGTVMHDTRRQQLLRSALLMLPEGDSALRALTLAASMAGQRAASALEERRRVTQAAVEMARRLDNPTVLLWTLNAQHLALWCAVPGDELRPIADEIIALARRTGDSEALLDGMLWLTTDSSESGDAVGAMRDSLAYVRAAEERGSPWHRYMALGMQTFLVAVEGPLTRAVELSQATRKAGLRLRESLAEAFFELRQLFLLYHQGFPASYPSTPPACVPAEYHGLWALRAVSAGDEHAARRALRAVVSQDPRDSAVDTLYRPVLVVMSEVAVQLRDLSAVRVLYERLLPAAGLYFNLQAFACVGFASYHLGLLAQALSEHERALDHLRSAVRETDNSPLFRAYASTGLAQSLLVTGALDEARPLLHEAWTIAADSGMVPLQTKIARLLTEAGSLAELPARSEKNAVVLRQTVEESEA